jgi:L-glutamine:2-deoxy-scyllo-inosose/3-amino-2,3-dideoxy-scyllo-inosose aminotransferase
VTLTNTRSENDLQLFKSQWYTLDKKHWQEIGPAEFDLPVCRRIYGQESVCFHHTVLMGTKADMDLILEAIRKIYDNADELR